MGSFSEVQLPFYSLKRAVIFFKHHRDTPCACVGCFLNPIETLYWKMMAPWSKLHQKCQLDATVPQLSWLAEYSFLNVFWEEGEKALLGLGLIT